MSPLVDVLRLVDSEEKPCMGYLYEAMDRANEQIEKNTGEDTRMCTRIWTIIDRRWDDHHHRPLHAAGFYLNPCIYFKQDKTQIETNREIKSGLFKAMERLIPEGEVNQVNNDLKHYRDADGTFGLKSAINQRDKMQPHEWWLQYGSDTPNLTKFAIKVLSQTCSASPCERNWSAFDNVVHPAPGNANGTLVNGILHHCTLPTIAVQNNDIHSESEDGSDVELDGSLDEQSSSMVISNNVNGGSVRPGIVHRLDKGTSGVLVVAKDEHSHAHLSEQFKQHTIHRVYISLTSGVPSPISGRIEVPIGRDTNNRIRMVAIPGSNNSRQARQAASRYKVLEVLAGGGSALVEWRLETGRTHQIRAHAKYLGIPLLGDEVYGGTKSMALSLLQPKIIPSHRGDLAKLVSKLDRPCLHAFSLGFKHPHTGEKMQFSCPPPADFAEILSILRQI